MSKIPIYEMANLTRNKSKQPFDLWVDSAGSSRKAGHSGLRVKASNNGVSVSVGFINGEFTTYKTRKEDIKKFQHIKELESYLREILPILELHWEEKIDDMEFLVIASYYSRKDTKTLMDAVDKAVDVLGGKEDVDRIIQMLENSPVHLN